MKEFRRAHARLDRLTKAWACGLAWLPLACQVDDRVLSDEPANGSGGSGGVTFEVRRIDGGLRDAGAGSSGGAGGRGPTFTAEQPDGSVIDGSPSGGAGSNSGGGSTNSGGAPSEDSGVPDDPSIDECDVPSRRLRIVNPSFNSDADGWPVDPNVTAAWDESDASLSQSSGSLSVVNELMGQGDSLVMLGASQCLEIAPNTAYQVCADYYVEPSASDEGTFPAEASGGAAAVLLTLFDGEGCRGGTTSNPTPVLQSVRGGWSTSRVYLEAAPKNQQYRSMLVRLVAAKQRQAEPVHVLFDNVRISVARD